MGSFIDLKGKRFGKLLVVKRANNYITPAGNYITMWECKCDCGNIKAISGHALRNGFTKSCGCIHKKHGLTGTRLFNIWVDMRQRCYNPKIPNYNLWGGKGITVCEEWKNNFQSFYDWAMTNGYTANCSIDRINGNGNYEPSNCRWATAKQQARNLSNNHNITISGETKTLSAWLEQSPITKSTFYRRVKQGISIEEALSLPRRKAVKING